MKNLLIGSMVVVVLAAYFIFYSPQQNPFENITQSLNITEPLLNYSHPNFTMSYSSKWYVQTNPETGVITRMLGDSDPDGRLVLIYITTLDESGPVTDSIIDKQVATLTSIYVNTYSETKRQVVGNKNWVFGESSDAVDPFYVDQALVDCSGTIFAINSLVPKSLPLSLPLVRYAVNTFKCK